CARFLGLPARYICGYRAADEAGGEPGAHAWAEGFAPKLGWVAFDATACLCADDRYVRVVVGFDAQDSAFVRGSHGGGEDAVETAIRVEQAGMQTQA
ncbi:MAG: transglutaminase family protein, partial [Roseiarcus sp.]